MQVVVTGVRSRTHLVHVSAYLRRLLAEDRRGTVEVDYLGGGSFLGNASVDSEDVARLLPDDARLRLRALRRLDDLSIDGGTSDLVYVAVGAPGVKPWLELRRRVGRARIRVVVTDEGLGTYGTWSTRHDAWRRQGVPEPWCSVRTAVVRSAERLLTSQRFAMYDRDNDWALDSDIAAEFRRRTTDGDGRGVGRVVLLTQPWVDMGALPESAYLTHVNEIRERVEAMGHRLAIRAHPAEDSSRYGGFETLPGHLPAELDGRVVESTAVIGGSSTALLNLAALHRRPAWRLLVPGLERLEDRLGTDQRSLMSRYLPAAVLVADLPTG